MACGRRRGVAVCALAAGLAGSPAAAGELGIAAAWTGVSTGPKSVYAYAGTNVSLGTIAGVDGLLARVEVGSGLYDGDDNPLGIPKYEASLLAGYRADLGRASASFYLGAAYSLHDDDDPDAAIRGAELGAKAAVELYLPATEAMYVAAFANYTTAFDTYHANIRAAYRLTEDVALGPAVAVLGSEEFDQIRFGAAAALDVFDYAELGLAAGYAFAEQDDETGLYFGLNVWKSF
jgi:hypothetical protein